MEAVEAAAAAAAVGEDAVAHTAPAMPQVQAVSNILTKPLCYELNLYAAN